MRIICVIVCLFISYFVSSASGYAQEGEVLRLGLADAIKMAIETSEDVQSKEQDVGIAKQLYGVALSNALPHLNSEVAYSYYPGKQSVDIGLPGMPSTSVSMQKDNDISAGITVTQNIFTFGKVRNAIIAAKYGKKTAFYDSDNSKREIAYNTAMTYISALLAQESMKIAKNSYNNASNTKHILKENYTYGRIPKADNIKASADVATRVPFLKNAERDLDLAVRDLKTLIGYFGNGRIVLADSLVSKFPKYDIDGSLSAMYDVDPRLKMLENSIKLSEYSAKAEKAKLLPTLSGFANYTYFGQSDHFDMDNADMQNLGTIGLALKIPLWNGGINWKQYKIAKHKKTKSELALKKTHKYLTRDLLNSISSYELLLDTYKANINAVNLSRKSFKAWQERFASGGAKITELNDQEIQLTNAKLSRALTLFRINQSIIAIERLISGGQKGTWQERYLNE